MKGLDGVATIVTGAGQGIGRAIAQRFLDEGARVLAVDLHGEGLKSFAENERLARMVADVTADSAPVDITRRCMAEFGSVGVLVNNAGVGNAPPLHKTTDEILDFQININLRAAFRLSRQVLPELRKSRGVVINIASSVALVGYRNSAAYAAAKAGVIALTRHMAAEYGSEGIRANAVAPGVIVTPLTEDRLKTPQFHTTIVATMPLGRAGTPEDVASAVAFLASDEARMITGQVLAVDGGQTSSVYISDEIVENWAASHDKA